MGKQRLLSYFFSQYCGVILIHGIAISWDINDSSVKLKQQQILSFGDKKHINVYILFLLPHSVWYLKERVKIYFYIFRLQFKMNELQNMKDHCSILEKENKQLMDDYSRMSTEVCIALLIYLQCSFQVEMANSSSMVNQYYFGC